MYEKYHASLLIVHCALLLESLDSVPVMSNRWRRLKLPVPGCEHQLSTLIVADQGTQLEMAESRSAISHTSDTIHVLYVRASNGFEV